MAHTAGVFESAAAVHTGIEVMGEGGSRQRPPLSGVAGAFKLPDRLTDQVKDEAVLAAFDLEFDLITLNRLAAQRAKPTGSVTSPHS